MGYFEGINSQRGIAWRCSDSLSLRKFLGIARGDDSPDHSSLSYIRNRLPFEVHRDVFIWVLALQRLRSEKTEQTFAHVCETGGARRTWLTGIDKLRKRYLLSAAGHNLSVLMRVLFNMGTPRGLQQFANDLAGIVSSLYFACLIMAGLKIVARRNTTAYQPCFQNLPTAAPSATEPADAWEIACISTGC